MSPVVHREQGDTFYFVVADLREPAHVHVGEGKSRRSDDAKLWLQPLHVARPGRFTSRELSRIIRIVEVHHAEFLEEWQRNAQ